MKSTAGIDRVDVSAEAGAGSDDVDIVDRTTSSPDSSPATALGPDPSDDVDDPDLPETAPDAASLAGADIHAVMLGLWASGLRYVIVHALVPVIGPLGPLAVGAALVIQVAGAAICVSGARSLWTGRHGGRYAYALIAAITCLLTLASLLAPAGF